MTFRWPWVARTLLDRAEARYDALLAEHHKLVDRMIRMRKRYDEPVSTKGPRAPVEPDETARKRAEAVVIRANRPEFIANAKQRLVADGIDEKLAEKEAQRLYDNAVGFEEVPG